MALSIPDDIADIDPAWLTRALRAGGRFFPAANGEVTAASPGPATAGIAITSQVVHLRLTIRPANAGPKQIVVKLRNPAWASGASMYQREVAFYRELADSNLPVPDCYYADYDHDSGAFVLLLEDLGDATPGHRLQGLDQGEATAVLDRVAAMHSNWWEQPRLASWPAKSYSRDRAAAMLARFHQRWPQLEARGQLPVDDELRAAVAAIDQRFVDELAGLATAPRTLVHADLHAENLILDGAGDALRVVVIDWQNACFANCAFDVAMVLGSVQPAVIRQQGTALLAGYAAALARPAPRLGADVATAVRWMLVGGINWFLDFEAESIRDAETVRGHWQRLAAAVTLVGQASDPLTTN